MEIFTIFSSWLLVAFIFYIFLNILRRSSMAVPKLPPNPPKLPIIGNLHQLLGKPHHHVFWELSKQYGPVMQIHIGSKPFIVISSPAMAKQVLKIQDHIFCSRPMVKATKQLTYNFLDIAFSPQSNHRREMRKILMSEFLGPKRAKFFNQVLVMEVETAVRSLSLHPSDTVVDLSNVLFTLVKEVVCKAAFGKNYIERSAEGLSWKEMLDEAAVFLKGSLSDNFPWFGEIFDLVSGWNRKLEKFFLHLDAWGENAGEFYPERFENLEVDFEMVPFGVGRRSCPAMNIAPSTIEFIIAYLLYWFDWKLNMQEEGTLIVHKKLPLCLVPVKYNWED